MGFIPQAPQGGVCTFLLRLRGTLSRFPGFPSPSNDMHIRRTGNTASVRASAGGLSSYVALPRSGDSSGVKPHMHPKTSWERLQEPVAVAINEAHRPLKTVAKFGF